MIYSKKLSPYGQLFTILLHTHTHISFTVTDLHSNTSFILHVADNRYILRYFGYSGRMCHCDVGWRVMNLSSLTL